MACKYCEARTPRKGAVYTDGAYPVGRPIVVSEHYNYIILSHHDGCLARPDEDEWHLTWNQNGCGFYIKVKFCPMCGRELPTSPEVV